MVAAVVVSLAGSSSWALPVPPHIVAIGQENDPYVQAGYLPATLYDGWNGNAVDPTGVADSTAALQKAIDDARDYALVTYLPAGTYRVSDTLRGRELPLGGWVDYIDGGTFGTGYMRWTAPTLVGPTAGPRPVIRLQDAAPGFGDPGNPKAVVMFYLDDPSQSPFEAAGGAMGGLVVRGIEVRLGQGNPGAVGVQVYTAQFSALEDVAVDATGAYAGFYGLPSAGGTTTNISVVGGRYGVIDHTCCGITIAGLILENQTVAGLHVTTYGTLTVAGFSIVEPSGVPAVLLSGPGPYGMTSLTDGTFDVSGSGPAVSNLNGVDIFLSNAYFHGSTTLVQSGSAGAIAAQSSGWSLLQEYSYTDSSQETVGPPATIVENWALVDGVKSQAERVVRGPAAQTPPADLVSRHVWRAIPSFEDGDAHNVLDLGVTGDGTTDDTAALQQAIDIHAKLFLPRGDYMLHAPLTLHASTQLFGVPGQKSILRPASTWDPQGTLQALLVTDDEANAATYLGDLAIDLPAGVDNSFFEGITWRAGAGSWTRNVSIGSAWEDPSPSAPRKVLRISGNGGGRWYATTIVDVWRHNNADYRHVLVEGTHSPLTFYGPNLEHSWPAPPLEVRAAANIRIFGSKTEADQFARFTDTDNLFFAGLTGNGAPNNMVVFTNTSRTLAPNLTWYAHQHQRATGPFVVETLGADTFTIEGKDNCSLFKRGEFDDTVFPHCGDARCDPWNETAASCAQDCGGAAAACGDAACNGMETCATCTADCGACGAGTPAGCACRSSPRAPIGAPLWLVAAAAALLWHGSVRVRRRGNERGNR